VNKSLTEEIKETGKRIGLYVIYERDTRGVLGRSVERIFKVATEGGNNCVYIDAVLCLFNTEMDAEEYINRWLEHPEEWEIGGTDEIQVAIEILEDLSEDYSYAVVNPPLDLEKGLIPTEIDLLIENLELMR
jgi:hypothetical protein